ncbi:hypothetical protein ACFQE8_13035 [Salinirubellus sp. GCM10025818]|jgi:hypothetical protein|uniref:hypothetical protein n=1 Tax=Salinirubellus TaxID=2162630 RepID=UPI0030CB409C
MPIGPDEWTSGRTDAEVEPDSAVKERLLEFLELNPEKAYTADELAKVYAREVAGDAIAGEDPSENKPAAPDHGMFERFLGRLNETVFRRSGRVKSALDELESEGYVESKTIERGDDSYTYYRVRRDR